MANPNPKRTNGFEKRPQDINKVGAKNKIYTILKEKGYQKEDINEAIKQIAFSTEAQVRRTASNQRYPMVLRIIATQFQQALEDKNWSKVEKLIEHVIGRPAQSVQSTVTHVEQSLLPGKYNKN